MTVGPAAAADLRINGTVSAVCFDGDGERLYAAGSDGGVYAFDIDTNRFAGR